MKPCCWSVAMNKPRSRAGHLTVSLLQVLFDDIAQSLIQLSSRDLQFQLVAAFLQFLGVPSGLSPPASCLYLAMDENSIFDNGLQDEKPLTFPNLSFSGVSCVGRSDPLGCRRWTRGHNREGEEFIRNIFHLVMPLFSGQERSQLCFSWLRYEMAKVTPPPPPRVGASETIAGLLVFLKRWARAPPCSGTPEGPSMWRPC